MHLPANDSKSADTSSSRPGYVMLAALFAFFVAGVVLIVKGLG